MPSPVDYTWTGADGAAWSSTIFPTIRNVRGGSDAPTIQSNAGRMITGSPPENCRIIAALADTFTDLDLTVSVRTTVSDTVEIGFRVTSNIDAGPDPDGGYVLLIRPGDGIVRFNTIQSYDFVAQAFDVPHDDGVWRKYRIFARGNRLKAKWWNVGDVESSFWKLDVIDAAYSGGRVFLGTWNNDDNITPSVVDFDDLHINEVLPPPPGIYLPNTLADALYIGDAPVVAAHRGDSEIVVP